MTKRKNVAFRYMGTVFRMQSMAHDAAICVRLLRQMKLITF
ncbi:hypothetical protein HMPREF0971_00833 [Segatella oris F0302]|uniref:Uncharacterized protein n=1 Tax=Segatella oris F0302 TaxID=649760 RepID=D1QPE3_9BACT|nr:hypothetical protein HMPREF0971_00833 [Segatella oris F0302]